MFTYSLNTKVHVAYFDVLHFRTTVLWLLTSWKMNYETSLLIRRRCLKTNVQSKFHVSGLAISADTSLRTRSFICIERFSTILCNKQNIISKYIYEMLQNYTAIRHVVVPGY